MSVQTIDLSLVAVRGPLESLLSGITKQAVQATAKVGPKGAAVPTAGILSQIQAFFSRLITLKPKAGVTGARARQRIEDIVPTPSASTFPVKTVAVATAGTAGAVATIKGFEFLQTPEGQEFTKTVIAPAAEGAASIGQFLQQNPLIIGGLILLGGVLILKK